MTKKTVDLGNKNPSVIIKSDRSKACLLKKTLYILVCLDPQPLQQWYMMKVNVEKYYGIYTYTKS
jgi:hypothetical protein